MADIYKIKATLDTTDVERGAKTIEQRLSAAESGGGSGMGAAKATATLREDTELIERKGIATARLAEHTRRLSTEQRASITLGVGTAAAQLGGAALKAGDHHTAAGALTGAAQGAAQLGTMLAPLGPQAALIGAAAGGITGAMTSLVGSMAESRKALEAEAKASRTAAEELRESLEKSGWHNKKFRPAAEFHSVGSDPKRHVGYRRCRTQAHIGCECTRRSVCQNHTGLVCRCSLPPKRNAKRCLKRAAAQARLTDEQTDLLKALHAPTRRDAMN